MAHPITALAAVAFSVLTWSCPTVFASTTIAASNASTACSQIASSISSVSDVYYPGESNYAADIAHFMASSVQQAACSVEPGSPQDVVKILEVLGSTRTAFAVKGGGHALNPTFSSTTGVQIAMTRFSGITYHPDTSTVDVGTGLIWDDVYYALEPYNVTVAGGRVSGIGISGFTLGGGYSFLSNQHGLTIDTVTGFELVTPTGAILNVTELFYPELMFALKGGSTNFGIVTRITYQTYPQGEVWGGLIVFPGSSMPAVSAAIGNYSANVSDPKADVLTAYNYAEDQVIGAMTLFYDAPSPPEGIFDEFLAIPALSQNISTRSFVSLFLTNPSNSSAGARGLFNTIMVLDYNADLCNVILNQTEFWGPRLALQSGSLVSYAIEPFLPTLYTHGAAFTSAWPPTRSQPYLPMNIFLAWSSSSNDSDFYSAGRETASFVTAAAVAMGQDVEDTFVYGNDAIDDTPITQIYGDQIPMLEAIRAGVDPSNVMGLTGGWKISD